ncbi:MAG TPA: hypothetical protein VEV63_13045 [Streptosporangiaceae bacterium]|nr:hypothetical protein [Streptosporangiaceae bacterium]
MDRLCVARDVYNEIARTIGSMRAEQGGALGWREDERVIRYFLFNAAVVRDWNPRGIRPAGFVRSRPPGLVRPSSRDLADSKQILAAIPELPYLVLLIAQTMPDTGGFSLVPYIVRRSGDEVVSGPAALEVLDGVIKVPLCRRARQ